MQLLRMIAGVWCVLACALVPADAAKRALVIGIDAYPGLGGAQLERAVADANAVGDELGSLGFQVTRLASARETTRDALLTGFERFAKSVSKDDWVVLFYAGHGVGLPDGTRLVPGDTQERSLASEALERADTISESDWSNDLRGRAGTVVVVIDACRNDRFTERAAGERGLRPTETRGIFKLYSADDGETALDRLPDGDASPYSVFTREFLTALRTPGLNLLSLAITVRMRVYTLAQSASHRQQPALYDRMLNSTEVYFRGAARQEATLVPPSPPMVPTPDPCAGPVVTASFPAQCARPLTAAQERALKPGDSFRECQDCPEMAVVPSGSFTMGSPPDETGRYHDEGPQHVVTIARPFAVGRFHVTRDQFAAFLADRPDYRPSSTCYTHEDGKGKTRADRSWRDPGFAQEGSHPVVCISWDDAVAYADWLTRKTGKTYRLLSEAEFEYAARARTSPGRYPRYWFGDDDNDLCRHANGLDLTFRDSVPGKSCWTVAPCNDGYAYTSPIGRYTQNAFGLFDMAGNAWQWTADCVHDNYNDAPKDGSPWLRNCSGSGRVARGGSWDSGIPRFLRAALRLDRTDVSDGCGVRVARTLM